MTIIALRDLEETDADALFEQMRDRESTRMAAFTGRDPDDRAAFDAHQRKLRASPEILRKAVTLDGEFVGTVASFVIEGDTEVTYWIDRRYWGRGIASRALELLLELEKRRPIYGRAASDNLGSLRVLAKAGFVRIGTERAFARARGEEIEETVLLLGE
jgi:RimJ/RimL family protein N-acetyltransferase